MRLFVNRFLMHLVETETVLLQLLRFLLFELDCLWLIVAVGLRRKKKLAEPRLKSKSPCEW